MGETGRINEKYMAMRPGGYLTAEDNAFLGQQAGLGSEVIDSGVGQQQSMARTRLAQRRIGGAAAEGVLGDIGAQGSLARSRLMTGIAGIGHQIYGANQRYAQGNVRQAWGNDIAAFQQRERQKAARQAMWGNVVGDLAKTAGAFFTGGASLLVTGLPGQHGNSGNIMDYSGSPGGGQGNNMEALDF